MLLCLGPLPSSEPRSKDIQTIFVTLRTTRSRRQRRRVDRNQGQLSTSPWDLEHPTKSVWNQNHSSKLERCKTASGGNPRTRERLALQLQFMLFFFSAMLILQLLKTAAPMLEAWIRWNGKSRESLVRRKSWKWEWRIGPSVSPHVSHSCESILVEESFGRPTPNQC